MTRNRPEHAALTDFRDVDIMYRIADEEAMTSQELADALGFDAETGARPIGSRLAWMRQYGMVMFNQSDRTWSLSRSGRRVHDAHLLAPQLRAVESMPDETMVEVMAHVTSRIQRGETMLAHMLRREFRYGTSRQNGRR